MRDGMVASEQPPPDFTATGGTQTFLPSAVPHDQPSGHVDREQSRVQTVPPFVALSLRHNLPAMQSLPSLHAAPKGSRPTQIWPWHSWPRMQSKVDMQLSAQ
jgi:hypothetical protein